MLNLADQTCDTQFDIRRGWLNGESNRLTLKETPVPLRGFMATGSNLELQPASGSLRKHLQDGSETSPE